ncbi:MAG: putative amidohydrolase YtcJ, partial [Pseudohongiellaceae bacterium]
NSLALSDANVSALTENPEGGVIRRLDGSDEPDGVMEETAMRLFPSQSTDLNDEQRRLLRRQALKVYASYGITTIQDSNIGKEYLNQLIEEAKVDPFPQDIVAYLWANVMSDDQLAAIAPTNYEGGIRLGGVKFTLDGSPQGRTAWLTEPYTQGPPSAQPDYVAYPSYAPELYIQRMPDLIARGVPVLIHANGDAAIDLMLDGVEGGLNLGEDIDHRSVVIHSQLMRPDHLPRFKELGVIASYYSVHPFFWGDWHRLSFGEERASFISPVAATAALDIPLTIHNDTPVVPPDMMRLVSITVNRLTRSGYVLGPDQRASVEQALKAITLGAAYQYFEEAEKGSITLGKRADFVLLESNPLSSEPEQLQDIAIVETFARGKSIYQR